MNKFSYIQCKAIFAPKDIPGEDFELYTPEQKKEHSHWSEFSFFMENIEAWNKSSDGYTTLWFCSGSTITIDIKYEDFHKKADEFKRNIRFFSAG